MSQNVKQVVSHLFEPLLIFSRAKDIDGIRTVAQLEAEPMLFSASVEFATRHGGPITSWVLGSLAQLPGSTPDDLHAVVDTRTHMLMPGMIPAIPGWHCDGLVRPTKYAQPIISSRDPRVRHFACFFASAPNVSRTVFSAGPERIDVDPDRVWGSVDEAMSRRPYGPPRVFIQREGEILEFDENTLHRAAPCVEPGWRMFFRLSFSREAPKDQIRKQTQVYTTSSKGW